MGKVPGGEPLCRVGKPEALSLDQERSPPNPWEKGEPHVCSENAAPVDSAFSSRNLMAYPVGGFLTKPLLCEILPTPEVLAHSSQAPEKLLPGVILSTERFWQSFALDHTWPKTIRENKAEFT